MSVVSFSKLIFLSNTYHISAILYAIVIAFVYYVSGDYWKYLQMQYILEKKLNSLQHYKIASSFWNPEEFMLNMDVFSSI